MFGWWWAMRNAGRPLEDCLFPWPIVSFVGFAPLFQVGNMYQDIFTLSFCLSIEHDRFFELSAISVNGDLSGL